MIDELIYAAGSLIVWSALYRDNPFYKISQRLIVGLYLGYTITSGLDVLYSRTYVPIFIEGKIFSILLIGTLLGVLSLTRLLKPIQWVSRYPISILAGIGAAVTVTGAISADIIAQLEMPSFTTLDGILLVIGTFTSITYFLFTLKHTGGLYYAAFVGKIFLMVALGCMLGLEFMSNISMSIGTMPYLVKVPGAYITIIALIILTAGIIYDRRRLGA